MALGFYASLAQYLAFVLEEQANAGPK
jgi:hypothetical protein